MFAAIDLSLLTEHKLYKLLTLKYVVEEPYRG